MILLTGASGFIGQHLLQNLIEVYGKNEIVALTSKPISNCKYILHENYSFDENLFIKNNLESIHTIIHAGAFTPKNNAESDNIAFSNSNILNTEKLLNAKLPNLKHFIFLSTLDVYDHVEIISEKSAVKPISLYGYSKMYCEEMVKNWGSQNNKLTQILRIGHVYGPGEEAYKKLIPLTISKILDNKTIEIWGSGEEKRSFIYIKDAVKAIVNAIKIEEDFGIINITSSTSISVKELVKQIIKLTAPNHKIEYIASNHSSRDLVFDNSKMKKHLLSEFISLEEGLSNEINFMKNKLN